MHEAEQIFVYEIKKDSAVIRRCFSRDTKAEIPETLDGFPVTEVGPYAFSAHMDEKELEQGLASGKLKKYVPEMMKNEKNIPALCGEQLETVVFSRNIKRVGRYCFYNCANLFRLEYYGALSDWGSGVFTGCHHVSEMKIYSGKDGMSYLKDVLDELPEEMFVEFMLLQEDAGEQEKYLEYRLVFPEFYEEGVENTPARNIETTVHGCGMMYRNCYRSRKIDLVQYDSLFKMALVLESERVTAKLSMNRLRYPYQLGTKAKEQYEQYVAKHGVLFADLLLEESDYGGIRWLMELIKKAGQPEAVLSLTDHIAAEASRRQQAEIMSFIMEFQREERHVHRSNGSGTKKRRRLEL